MPSYNPKVIEPRWQRYWQERKTFRTPDTSDKPKLYILDMFPYPSGSGLHVGHPEGYTATDILVRYRRMKGFNVLHPMGWDAFGLPAEQHAIATGEHPSFNTQRNIDTFRRQIQMLGFSYDWEREVDTTDPAYFKWTQWIFLVLYDTWYDHEQKRGRPIAELAIPDSVKKGGPTAVRQFIDGKRLAYQAEVPVNWCAELGTVLANEEVIDGKSERGSHPVVRMPLRQWLLRITDYAERLLADLALVDWPEPIKKMQREWIGKSEGAEVDFRLGVVHAQMPIRVFTTRPDTLFGATYMVLAPEHPLVDLLTTQVYRPDVQAYKLQAARKSDLERTELAKKKSGVFIGSYAVNPVNGERIPIWIADYVLAGYGTGAIMAVPAHDERDFEFAKQFGLPIRPVVTPPATWLESTSVAGILRMLTKDRSEPTARGPLAPTLSDREMAILKAIEPVWAANNKDIRATLEHLYRNHVFLFEQAYCDEGIAFNSGPFDGLPTSEFKKRITDKLQAESRGQRKINYKLRDWLFSRQRYWGEPFPILHELDSQGRPTGNIVTVPAEELPLELPELADYKPTGNPEPPLSKATEWLTVKRGNKTYRRETNTMPQWAGSCWYYLRYIDPKNEKAFCDPAKLKQWLPVDLYVGGAEHAVLHLLYSRFWHKVLYDRGHVPVPEPFQRLVNQGMILGEMDYHIPWEVYEEKKLVIDVMGLQVVRVKDDDREIAILRNPSTEPGKFAPLTEDQVVKEAGKMLLKGTPIELIGRADKMSKARGNVINPDDVVNEYGADSLRLYEMFMGPLEATKPWSMRGVEGVSRFLARVWRLTIDDRAEETKLASAVQDVEPDVETRRLLHHTIKRVTDDLESMSFNTAISAMMELSNHLTRQSVRPRSVLQTFVLLLGPFAPHLAEELWQALGGKQTLAYEPWPTYDPELLKADEIEVPVQVNGKLRAKLTVPANIDANALEAAARADERVKAAIEGKTIKKVIIPPGNKLVNLVVG